MGHPRKQFRVCGPTATNSHRLGEVLSYHDYPWSTAHGDTGNRHYNDLLARAAETAGWQGWTAQLDSGVSRAQVVQEIEASPEYRTMVVTGYYQSILSRAPDAPGLAAWEDALATGRSLEAAKAAFF